MRFPARTAAWLALGLMAAACSAGEVATTTAPTTAPPATSTTTTRAATSTSAATTTSVPTDTTTTPPSTTTLPPTTTVTTVPAWWREVTPDAPLRVWVIGDSLAPPVGTALRALGAADGLMRVSVEAHGGTGLARPEIFDWPALIAAGAPAGPIDVVVVLLGTNDGQGLGTPQGWAEFGTPAWEEAYGELVGSLMDQLLGLSRRVYWVGQPIMGGVHFDSLMRRINMVVREEAAARLDARIIDIYRLFQGEDGGFTTQLVDEGGTLVMVRSSDGIHYTSGGGRRLAEAIWEVVAADWRFPDG